MSTDLMPGYERVHTVVDYWDGPRKGIADYLGKPHIYECVFDEANDIYSDSFLLVPVETEVFRLAMEHWAIWRRWELAYHKGQTNMSTHPALPEDGERHKELEGVLKGALVIDPAAALTRIGHFEPIAGEDLPKGVGRPLQVKWTET